MFRKYLVLGIMMGALALTGCGAEEEKDNKEEVKATQEVQKDNGETVSEEDKTTEEDKTSEDKESVNENTDSEEDDFSEELYFMNAGEKKKVAEWSKGITDGILYFYGSPSAPKSGSGGEYYKWEHTRMDIAESLLIEEECTLEEGLIKAYKVLSMICDINGDGTIKDVTGEYVTINGIECYRYQGMASASLNRDVYVVGYLFDNNGYKVMIQSQVTTLKESEKEAAIEEANHNVDVAVKGLRLEAN